MVAGSIFRRSSVRHALENGHTLVGSRVEVFTKLNKITVDEEANTISVDAENHDGIIWTANGEARQEGESIDYSEMQNAVLRFEIKVGDAVPAVKSAKTARGQYRPPPTTRSRFGSPEPVDGPRVHTNPCREVTHVPLFPIARLASSPWAPRSRRYRIQSDQ